MRRRALRIIAAVALVLLLAGGLWLVTQNSKAARQNRALDEAIGMIQPSNDWSPPRYRITRAGPLCRGHDSPCGSAEFRYRSATLTRQQVAESLSSAMVDVRPGCLDPAPDTGRDIICSARAATAEHDVDITVRNAPGDLLELTYSIRPRHP